MQGLLREIPHSRPFCGSSRHGRPVHASDRRAVAVCARTSSPLRTASGRAASTSGSKPSTVTSRKIVQQGTQTVKGATGKGSVQQPSAVARSPKSTDPDKQPGQFYFNFTGFPFPLGPYFTRRTVRNEVEKDTIWTFDQTQGLDFFCLYTPVRMTVIKLKSGGLWVHSPVAPTAECIRLIKELNAPVEYIILPTFAYEHKVFVGPFSRKFPKAKVYSVPYTWSFPINLPDQFFGIFPTGTITTGDPTVPWADEIDQKVFLPPPIGPYPFVRFTEVAFFHKKTRTVMLTDAVIYIDDQPPEVVPRYALLELGRDNWLARFIAGNKTAEEVRAAAQPQLLDTPENITKGWKRMCLLVLYFNPFDLFTPEPSFDAISKRLIVGPVVETLVYNKTPKAVTDWVDSICEDWNIRQIIPAHFTGPIKTTNAEFKRAFTFCYDLVEERFGVPAPLEAPAAAAAAGPLGFLSGLFGGAKKAAEPVRMTRPVVFPEMDLRILNTINDFILKVGAVRLNADVPAPEVEQR